MCFVFSGLFEGLKERLSMGWHQEMIWAENRAKRDEEGSRDEPTLQGRGRSKAMEWTRWSRPRANTTLGRDRAEAKRCQRSRAVSQHHDPCQNVKIGVSRPRHDLVTDVVPCHTEPASWQNVEGDGHDLVTSRDEGRDKRCPRRLGISLKLGRHYYIIFLDILLFS